MKKILKITSVLLACLMLFSACGETKVDGGKYADCIDENGRWKDVTASEYVTLGEYKGIKVSKAEITPADDKIQAEIDALFEEAAYENHIDGTVEDGMTVNIDYVGRIDGTEFANGSTNGQGTDVTIGVTSYIDDFLEQLIGHKTGQTFDVEVTFPVPYDNNPDLAGKDAVFETTINYIVENVIPEQTDENVEKYLKDAYAVSTLEELKKDIFDEYYESNLLDVISQALLDGCTVAQYPEVIDTFYKTFYTDYYTQYAQAYNYTLEELLPLLGFESIDQILEDSKEEMTDGANFSLIVQAIAEKEDIKLTVKDTEAYMKDVLGMEELDKYYEFYGYNYFAKSALLYKVQTMLEESAEITE